MSSWGFVVGVATCCQLPGSSLTRVAQAGPGHSVPRQGLPAQEGDVPAPRRAVCRTFGVRSHGLTPMLALCTACQCMFSRVGGRWLEPPAAPGSARDWRQVRACKPHAIVVHGSLVNVAAAAALAAAWRLLLNRPLHFGAFAAASSGQHASGVSRQAAGLARLAAR